MKIYKWSVCPDKSMTLEMPITTKILPAVFMQGTNLCFWGIVNETGKMENRTFFIAGTGGEFNGTDKEYIGSVQDGLYIWHLFEIK